MGKFERWVKEAYPEVDLEHPTPAIRRWLHNKFHEYIFHKAQEMNEQQVSGQQVPNTATLQDSNNQLGDPNNPTARQEFPLESDQQTAHQKRIWSDRLGVEIPGAAPKQYGDPRYLGLLQDAWALHQRKAKDYGSDRDPLENLRRCEEIGIPAWKGAIVRMLDKVKRIQHFCLKGDLANESVEDSLQDLSAYAYLALILLREDREMKGPTVASEKP